MAEVFSLEYLHYDGTLPIDALIAATERDIGPVLSLYPDAQRGVMFDDIHSDMGFGSFMKAASHLSQPPHSVYAESDFTPFMKRLVATLEASGFTHTEEDRRCYIVKNDKKYRAENKFLLSYDDVDGDKFSCPALVAASYLYRLGHFGTDQKITALAGDSPLISKTGAILSILPAKYMPVEANARTICELIDPACAARIRYFFY